MDTFDVSDRNSWYFGPMSRQDATEVLMNERERGVFLVRDSNSIAGDYVLCVRSSVRDAIIKQILKYVYVDELIKPMAIFYECNMYAKYLREKIQKLATTSLTKFNNRIKSFTALGINLLIIYRNY
ncbi:uncharacterized protein Dyak_GE14540, isoform E [Drosophila yakuba]|uniref:Uncharacterized protein, isoform E n=1 Tax=Drosophila yakuba TaxID=7245 RepID=A0A0R1EA23_DROYA|nr:uncharacterized protein Dyak_GE14540, isoform E [Drosophila yakuba]